MRFINWYMFSLTDSEQGLRRRVYLHGSGTRRIALHWVNYILVAFVVNNDPFVRVELSEMNYDWPQVHFDTQIDCFHGRSIHERFTAIGRIWIEGPWRLSSLLAWFRRDVKQHLVESVEAESLYCRREQ
jgi:hypothetical protein